MIKFIIAFATLAVFASVSALAELGSRQQEHDLSEFVGEWYVAAMSANLTNLWNNTTQTMGLSCVCPRFNITLCSDDSVLKVGSVCDLHNATTSTIVGNATMSGVMTLERQVGNDDYIFIYSAHNTTVSINDVPFNRTMDNEYTTEIQSRILHVPPCDATNCNSQGQPAGILSWSTNDPSGYKALLSSNSTLNETGYNELINATSPGEAEGLVRLNTTCNAASV